MGIATEVWDSLIVEEGALLVEVSEEWVVVSDTEELGCVALLAVVVSAFEFVLFLLTVEDSTTPVAVV